MALPKILGDNPTDETVLKNGWRLVVQNVNAARFWKKFQTSTVVWYTYVKQGTAAPVGMSGFLKWTVTEEGIDFKDGSTARDLYLYSVGEDSLVGIES